jgi:hypothetical protein
LTSNWFINCCLTSCELFSAAIFVTRTITVYHSGAPAFTSPRVFVCPYVVSISFFVLWLLITSLISSNFSNYQFCKQKCVTEIGLWMVNLDCRLTYMYRKVWRWEKGNQNNGQSKMDIRTKIANQWSTKHSTKNPNIENQKPHKITGVNSGAPEGWSIFAPLTCYKPGMNEVTTNGIDKYNDLRINTYIL